MEPQEKKTTTTLHPFNGFFSRTTWISRYQKSKTSLNLHETRDVGVLGCSGISWTICKQSASRSRQITTSTPHRSIFIGQLLFLMPNQQCESSEGTSTEGTMQKQKSNDKTRNQKRNRCVQKQWQSAEWRVYWVSPESYSVKDLWKT